MKVGKLALVVAITLAATPVMAQHVGFRVGIAPAVSPTHVIGTHPGFHPGFHPGVHPGVHPGFHPGFHPVTGMAPVHAITPFVNTPVAPFQSRRVLNPPIVVPGFSQPMVIGYPGPQGPTVAVPTVVYVPGAVYYPNTVVYPGTTVIVQQPHAPRGHFRTGPAVVSIGTPRDRVLQQLGQPTVTVFSHNGETLHFKDGISVFIQNGHVAGPR